MNTRELSKGSFEQFRLFLQAEGFSFEDRPYQIFLARKSGVVVNLYASGKVVVTGTDQLVVQSLQEKLDALGAKEVAKEVKVLPALEVTGTRIGTDEVGKGDYYGPLVVAGTLVTSETEKQLVNIGVRDSKTLSDTTISNMAIKIRRILGIHGCEEISISPLKYNLLHQKLHNVNRILGWAHARCIENLLSNGQSCEVAVADQFGDERYIHDSLMRKGRKIKLIQVPKAERDVAVAAASVLARDVFLHKLDEMRESYELDFPKGATHVVEFGKKLVETHGVGVLQNVAKLHFSTTAEVMDGPIPAVKETVNERADLETVPREPSEKESRDGRLEIFNLISNFEADFRKFIRENLSEAFGSDWWNIGVEADIRKKCERIQLDELKKGKKVEAIDCLDFRHYSMIITSKSNWERVFAKFFGNKERVLARLVILKDWRDPAYHVRGAIGSKEKAEVVGAINQLRVMIKLQTSLEEFKTS
jgi:ribonuclease HIII